MGRECLREGYRRDAHHPGRLRTADSNGGTMAEKKEQRSDEEKYRRLIDNIHAGVVLHNPDTSIAFSNRRSAELLGLTQDRMRGKKAIDPSWCFLREDQTSMPLDEYPVNRVLSTLEHLEDLVVGVTVPGRKDPCWVLVNAYPLFDDRGELENITVTFVDISRLKQAEEKITGYFRNLELMVRERTDELKRALYDAEKARDQIDGILKSVADGLIVTDLYNRIVLMNRAAEKLLGIRFSEVIDRPIDFAIEDQTVRERVIYTLKKKKTGYTFDFELPGKEVKTPRVIRARTSVIEDRGGRYTGIVTVMNDVTRERELDRIKTDFITTSAHELRDPLTAIRGFSEILINRSDIGAAEKARFLDYINRKAVYLTQLINDLLDISRIESGRGFSLRKKPIRPAEIIRSAVSIFEKESGRHRFELEIAGDCPEIPADEEKVSQVLENLLSNAVKYSPEGGTIVISAAVSDNLCRIAVKDRGMGMSPQEVDRIFENFYRADTTNSAIPGTGLGMSIVKYIAEAHGGSVCVESETGKGTTVAFTLPLNLQNQVGRENGQVDAQ